MKNPFTVLAPVVIVVYRFAGIPHGSYKNITRIHKFLSTTFDIWKSKTFSFRCTFRLGL